MLNSFDDSLENLRLGHLHFAGSGPGSFNEELQIVSSHQQSLDVFIEDSLVELGFGEFIGPEEKCTRTLDQERNQVGIHQGLV